MTLEHIRWIPSGSSTQDDVLAFAARELSRYARRLTGTALTVNAEASLTVAPGTVWLGLCTQVPLPPGCELSPAPWDDGFAFWADGGRLFIAGQNARSVLFGVYAYLESQGVRYLRSGDGGEVVPDLETLALPVAPVVEQARYRHRGVCIEGAPSIAHALGMVDWCAKVRMNTIFLQFLSSQYFYNLWYERPYNPQFADKGVSEEEALAYDDQLIASMKRRGLILHRVGHGWTSAAFEMPRSGWVKAGEEVQPQYVRWLAELDGVRALYHDIPINTELCYSHKPAFDAFVETIVQYCDAHPELDVVHVWLSDATNNKCECAECRKLTISDWYAKVINALSAALHERVPAMRFVFLCYIELLWPPEQVAIDASAGSTGEDGNAIMMFAPISRCYGHALTDPACDDGRAWPRPALNQYASSRYNAFYVDRVAGWREAFAGDSFDYDYHLMWAIWQHLTDTHLARIFHSDLQDLGDLGLNGIVSCQSFRAFYPSGLAMAALSQSLWNPDLTWPDLRARYLEAAYGEHAAFAGAYLETIESFLETGDPHWRTPPLSDADEERLDQVAAFVDTTLHEIAMRRTGGPDRTRDRSLDLLAYHAQLLQYVVAAYRARREGDREASDGAFDRAIAFLQDTEPAYSTYIDTMLALRYLERAKAQA
ncbi:MAG: DUF4838 domain-containing protein [Anaerolineae bacterium]|nr:DUF4838 domain-containing protein [Anaerolineae bacterium]